MDILTVLGVVCIVLAILVLISYVPGGIVVAIILAVLGLLILGGGLNGTRGRRL